MTFEEWLVREHGFNHGWTFSEVDAARDAWESATEAEREACAKVCEALANDVERCYRMLLSEPDTKGALFKAENILREALAGANAKTHNPLLTCAKERSE